MSTGRLLLPAEECLTYCKIYKWHAWQQAFLLVVVGTQGVPSRAHAVCLLQREFIRSKVMTA